MTVKVLTFSSLYPSAARPRHGIFVETRLRQLLHDCDVDARVIAPVPWFPFRADLFGAYARFALTPRHEARGGLEVSHPRYLMLPRLGVRFQPASMARAAAADVAALGATGWTPDVIDAHYFYPDGVAAALLAERLRVPFVVTARGTDVNVLAQQPGTGEKILWAARRAAAVITVSTRLKEVLVGLGVDASKVSVLRNGVDLELFRPEDRAAARRRLGLPEGRLAACVGNLVPEKGQALAIEALCHLPDWRLMLVGGGASRGDLQALAQRLGVAARVIF
ncbi:MAG TPA: glycosyltransferase, partial [Albitalea sp.]|nr:glycosyltransferase [Albitalea sp.]